MKFDDKYPSARDGDVVEGSVELLPDCRAPCSICSLPTAWWDLAFDQPVCSDECALLLWMPAPESPP